MGLVATRSLSDDAFACEGGDPLVLKRGEENLLIRFEFARIQLSNRIAEYQGGNRSSLLIRLSFEPEDRLHWGPTFNLFDFLGNMTGNLNRV